jgi:hypothetical protein
MFHCSREIIFVPYEPEGFNMNRTEILANTFDPVRGRIIVCLTIHLFIFDAFGIVEPLFRHYKLPAPHNACSFTNNGKIDSRRAGRRHQPATHLPSPDLGKGRGWGESGKGRKNERTIFDGRRDQMKSRTRDQAIFERKYHWNNRTLEQ